MTEVGKEERLIKIEPFEKGEDKEEELAKMRSALVIKSL